MATFTAFLSLRKPSTADTVNVELDINENMDAIDTAVAALDGRLDDLEGVATMTSFTPDIQSTGTAPSVGAGSKSGFYVRVGKLVFAYYSISCGSGTSAGSGFYRFMLPSGLPIASAITQGYGPIGHGHYQDNGGSNPFNTVVMYRGDSSDSLHMYSVGDGGIPGSPFNAGLGQYINGRQYVFSVIYPTSAA